MPTSESIN